VQNGSILALYSTMDFSATKKSMTKLVAVSMKLKEKCYVLAM
jgi:hypothetical protein